MKKLSEIVKDLKQSGIRAASTRCAELQGINLGQGLCDIPTHDKVKNAAKQAITENKNLYASHSGVAPLRTALAEKIAKFNHVKVDPQTQILVAHGSTGAFVSAIKTLFNPGDEVILFEPFYAYHKKIIELLGMTTKVCDISLVDFHVDMQALAQLITPKTKGILVCTPNNPTGKVFSKQELIQIGELAKKHDLYVITDEIYEYITYPGFEHISLASLNDYADFTVTISGFSKTYNVTGWRVGYAYGPAEIIHKMTLVHDLLYICPPTPLQHAMLEALQLGDEYYQNMRDDFLVKRDYIMRELRALGFTMPTPEGGYYLMVDCEKLNWGDDQAVANKLLEQAKVAVVPGGSFYLNPKEGQSIVRVCYALEQAKLEAAIANIKQLLAVKN